MPVTVRGGDILFNDGTTQSTAAGAVNTTTVLNATAGASVGAVGTYAFAVRATDNTVIYAGSTSAGSSLRYSGASKVMNANNGSSYIGGTALSGTWRAMGDGRSQIQEYAGWAAIPGITLWLRIS